PRNPRFRNRIRKPIVPVLKLMLKPVFRQVGVSWSPPPIRWGLYATCLGVLIVPIMLIVILATVNGRTPSGGNTQDKQKAEVDVVVGRLIGRWKVDNRGKLKTHLAARGMDPSGLDPGVLDGFKALLPKVEYDFQADGTFTLAASADDAVQTSTGK